MGNNRRQYVHRHFPRPSEITPEEYELKAEARKSFTSMTIQDRHALLEKHGLKVNSVSVKKGSEHKDIFA